MANDGEVPPVNNDACEESLSKGVEKSTDIKKTRHEESPLKMTHTRRSFRFYPYPGSCRLESKNFFDDFSDRGPGPIC